MQKTHLNNEKNYNNHKNQRVIDKAIGLLEFDLIKQQLAELAVSEEAKTLALALKQKPSLEAVNASLSEIEEALAITKTGSLPPTMLGCPWEAGPHCPRWPGAVHLDRAGCTYTVVPGKAGRTPCSMACACGKTSWAHTPTTGPWCTMRRVAWCGHSRYLP